MIELMLGDCIEKMSEIAPGTVDMILADPPYGVTACEWDSIIDLEIMWEQLRRVIKPNGAIVIMASQPFTSSLIMSASALFKYCWVWNKGTGSNFQQVKKQPMRYTEDVCVFSKEPHTYHPIKTLRKKPKDYSKRTTSRNKNNNVYNRHPNEKKLNILIIDKYPSNIIEISSQIAECNNVNRVHPTQKPIALMEYLIRTYTRRGETVLDFTMGSGTTGVACVNLDRGFIGIELDENYFNIANERIKEAKEKVDD